MVRPCSRATSPQASEEGDDAIPWQPAADPIGDDATAQHSDDIFVGAVSDSMPWVEVLALLLAAERRRRDMKPASTHVDNSTQRRVYARGIQGQLERRAERDDEGRVWQGDGGTGMHAMMPC